MAYDNSKPFIALELYMKEKQNRLKPTSYEYQTSSKVQFRDTFTKKQYAVYEFGNWLKEPHVIDKIQSGCTLHTGSVDLTTEQPDKYTGSSKERKMVWFFKDKNPYNQGMNKIEVPPIAKVVAVNVPVQTETVQRPKDDKASQDAWDRQVSDESMDDNLESAPF